MNTYVFRQLCRPRGDFRIDEVIDFLHLIKEAFRCPVLYDSRDRPVDLTGSGLQKIFEKKTDKLFPSIGATLDFFTIQPRKRDDNTVRIEIHTGTQPDEIFVDTYDLSIGERSKLPDFDYFEKCIEIFRPFEACLEETENEYKLDAYDRQQAIPKFDRPAIIRGFHYLDEGMARSIGGIDYCLKAPAWHVERFCEGVLIELVPGPFDTDNPEHLKIQKEAMEYFDLF
ncbi:MAG: hypothetical protein FJ118_15190 [Deltaproteobacteria bacterium]|nr:hypothetical protein [Deltaproteobacteria bacterium]